MGVRRTANMCSYQTKKQKEIERANELHDIIRRQGARIEELKQAHADDILDLHFKWLCGMVIGMALAFCCGAFITL